MAPGAPPALCPDLASLRRPSTAARAQVCPPWLPATPLVRTGTKGTERGHGPSARHLPTLGSPTRAPVRRAAGPAPPAPVGWCRVTHLNANPEESRSDGKRPNLKEKADKPHLATSARRKMSAASPDEAGNVAAEYGKPYKSTEKHRKRRSGGRAPAAPRAGGRRAAGRLRPGAAFSLQGEAPGLASRGRAVAPRAPTPPAETPARRRRRRLGAPGPAQAERALAAWMPASRAAAAAAARRA